MMNFVLKDLNLQSSVYMKMNEFRFVDTIVMDFLNGIAHL
jgi:hypothetical protein